MYGYNRSEYLDFSMNAGGPIKKDKLWYFGGVQWRHDHFSEPGTNPESPKMQNDSRYFGKATWQVSKNNKINGSLECDGVRLPRTVSITSPVRGGRRRGRGQPGARTCRGPRSSATRRSWTCGTPGSTAGTSGSRTPATSTTPGHYDTATGVYSVNSASWYDGNVWKTQVAGKVSHYVADAWGSHDLRGGVQFIDGGSKYKQGYSGGMTYNDFRGQYDQLVVQDPYYRDAVMRNTGLFVDDTWNLSTYLSLTLGLRYDHAVGTVPDYPDLDAAGNETGVTIDNPGKVVTWNNVSPRLGANIKFDSAGKTVGRVHYGRFYSQLQTRIYSPLNRAIAPATTYRLDPVTGARLSVISVTNPLIGIPELQEDLGAPYTDQISVGLDRQLTANISIGGSYIYKKGGNLIGRTKPYATFTAKPWTYLDRNLQSRRDHGLFAGQHGREGQHAPHHQPADGSTRTTTGSSSR